MLGETFGHGFCQVKNVGLQFLSGNDNIVNIIVIMVVVVVVGGGR